MFLKWLFRFFSGYVTLRIYGYSPERFMNICSYKGIELYCVRCFGKEYELQIAVSDFHKLKDILRKTGTKMHIVQKKGVPFLLFRYRRHKGFVFSIIFTMFFLFCMSHMIWSIQIDGNVYITDAQLLKYLEEHNIKTGIFVNNVDCDVIESMIRNDYPDIIWVSAQMKGSALIVEVQEVNNETDTKKESLLFETGSDIVASNDGTVVSIVTRNGTPMVKAGDTIEAGTILVSGKMCLYDDYGTVVDHKYCEADADVMIHCVESYYDVLDLTYCQPTKTNKKNIFYKIIFNNKTFIVGKKEFHVDNYSEKTQQKQLKIGSMYSFPIQIIKSYREEFEWTTCSYTEEEIKEILGLHFSVYSKNLGKKGFQIVDNNVKIKVNEKQVEAAGEVTLAYYETAREKTPVESLKEEEGLEKNGIDADSNGNSS